MAELSTFGAIEERATQQEATPSVVETTVTEPSQVTPATTEATTITTQEPVVTQEVADESTSAVQFSLGDEQQVTSISTVTDQNSTQQTYNWRDEIKKVDRNELLKEAAISDFALELDAYIKSGGQPIDYLQAKAVDYNKVSDEDLIKADLQKQYPTFNASQIQLMFNRKYSISEDASDEDKEFVELQLKADAHTSRQNKISEQQKFKVPEAIIPQKDEAYEQWKLNTQAQSQRIEEVKNFYFNHPATKTLNESKRVTISLGDNVAPFNFTIDKPELITKVLTDDGSSWNKLTSTPQGEPDVAKQQLLTLFAYNPQKFIQDIFKYGQSFGLKQVVEQGQNAKKPEAIVSTMTHTGAQTVSIGKYSASNNR